MAYIHGAVAVPELADTSDLGEPIVIAPPATQTKVKTVLALPGFTFADNKLKPEHVTAIKDFAKVVAADKTPGRLLRFVGHTDSAGPPKVNLRLGFGRAQMALMRMTEELESAVRDHLVDVHVRRRSRAALEDVDDELVAQPSRTDLAAGRDDGPGTSRGQGRQLAMSQVGRLLDACQCPH